jgi:prepilin-type N-terminal cleavage/methylation domain-containing protein
MPKLKNCLAINTFHLKPNHGFTLIETLIGLAVVGIIGSVIFSVLGRTFQSNAKTVTISTIKQNGQNALTQIDQMIRGADSLVCIGNTNNSTVTLVKSGSYQRITFYPETSSNNGYIAIDYPLPADEPSLANCTSDTTTLYRRCPQNFCNSVTPVNQIVVTDRNNTTGVSVQASAAYFTKQSLPGSQDSLTIDFNLSPAVNAGDTFEKSIGPNNQVNFKTSVDLR